MCVCVCVCVRARVCLQGYVYIMLSIVTLTVVYTVHLYYNSRVNAYSRGGNLTLHLRSELALCLITAGLCLSVPAFLAYLFVSYVIAAFVITIIIIVISLPPPSRALSLQVVVTAALGFVVFGRRERKEVEID